MRSISFLLYPIIWLETWVPTTLEVNKHSCSEIIPSINNKLYSKLYKLIDVNLRKTHHCKIYLQDWRDFFLFLSGKKANKDPEWDGNGVVDWRKRVKCQGLLLITRMASSIHWMESREKAAAFNHYPMHTSCTRSTLFQKTLWHTQKKQAMSWTHMRSPDSFMPRLNV